MQYQVPGKMSLLIIAGGGGEGQSLKVGIDVNEERGSFGRVEG